MPHRHLCTLLILALATACGGDSDDSGDNTSSNTTAADAGTEDTSTATDTATSEDTTPDTTVEVPENELRPGPVTFPAAGSFSEASGRGSFAFGAATAATQIEDQNVHTDWYVWTTPEPEGLGHGTFIGDAARGYSMAMEDVALMEELGLDVYRFSISWARVEPQRDVIDEEAIQHYSDFIDALLEAGITPMITLHHFSNPRWIDDPTDTACEQGPSDANLCGWNHPEGGAMVIEEFAEHARLMAERFGDRVDGWCTLNEPINYILAAYGVGEFPPGKQGIINFETELVGVMRNYVTAHARAYDAIKAADTIDADSDGEAASVGLTQAVIQWLPARDNALSDNPEDIAGVERIDYVYNLLFVESIQRGAFDPDLDQEFDEPQPDWEGKLDWLGVQYYFRTGATANNGIIPVIEVTPCFEGFDFGSCIAPEDPTHLIPDMGYEYWEPGVYTLLTRFGARWPELPLIVTESGLATNNGERRSEHVVRSLEQIWRAVEEGVDVRGYYHWSLTDNFEWAFGYEPRFGLYFVDYDDDYNRTATAGAVTYREIITGRALTEEHREKHGGLGPMSPEPK